MPKNWFTTYFNHWFWPQMGFFCQARSKPTSQNHGFHAGCCGLVLVIIRGWPGALDKVCAPTPGHACQNVGITLLAVCAMATITLHDVPEDLLSRLQQRAQAHRRSFNSEVVECLKRQATGPGDADPSPRVGRCHRAREPLTAVADTNVLAALMLPTIENSVVPALFLLDPEPSLWCSLNILAAGC